MTDTLIPPLDTLEEKHETETTEVDNEAKTYNMTEQELRLQHEEEKYGIYMSTFCYEGDDSDLELDMDIDSNAMAYPFLDWKKDRMSRSAFS